MQFNIPISLGDLRPHLALAPLIIPTTLSFLSLTLPPSSSPLRLSRTVFLPLILLSTYYAYRVCQQLPSPFERWNYPGMLLPFALRAVDAFLLSGDPHATFVRDGQAKDELSTWAGRAVWSGRFWATCRGIGWNWRVNGVPRPSTLSARVFVIHELFRYAVCAFVLEALHKLFHTVPYLSLQSTTPLTLAVRLFLSSIFATRIVLSSAVSYSIASAFFVAVGEARPEDCPDLIGDVTEAWCLRRFWALVWHSLWKRPFTALPQSLFASLGWNSRDSWPLTFLVTGCYHALMDYALDPSLGLGSLLFFSLQPLGIKLEKTVGIKKGPLGYLWVASWLLVTASPVASDLFRAGLFHVKSSPASAVFACVF